MADRALKSEGIRIANAFSIFMLISYVILAVALLSIVYGQLKQSNQTLRDQYINERIASLKIEFEGFIRNYEAALVDQTRFSVIRQAVMQPVQYKEIISDFFNQIYLIGGQPQQVLVDFQGESIYQRTLSPSFDYTNANDVKGVLSSQVTSGFSVNFDSVTNQFFWRISVPVLYLENTEGALITEIPFIAISNYLELKSRLIDERINIKQGKQIVASIGRNLSGEIRTAKWPELGLNIEYIADVSSQLAHERQILGLVLMVLTVALLLFALISFYLGRKYFVAPILALRDQTNLLADGKIREFSEIPSNIKELNDLAKNSTNMSRQIHKRTKAIEFAYQQLRENQSQLVQSEKMASLGFLSAGVAHEINNPAGFVKSNIEVLSDYFQKLQQAIIPCLVLKALTQDDYDKVPNWEEIKPLLKQVDACEIEYIMSDIVPLFDESLEGMNRIQDIVNSMKKFARPDSDRMEMANINDEIKNTVRLVWNELKYKCELELELGEIPSVFCFPSKLNQVFINLLINASQAMSAKGKVIVRTMLVDEEILVYFEDNGKGMTEAVMSRIFEPFFSTKLEEKGTGLGLSISSDILTRHGGSIKVSSEVGKGTVFCLHIPVKTLREETTTEHVF